MAGARIILNSEYFHIAQPGEKADGKFSMTKDQATNFVNYVATREGVSINFNSFDLTEEEANRAATFRQKQTIEGLLREVPSAKDTFEYEDYKKSTTVGNASELISRAAEMGYGGIQEEKEVGTDEARNFVEYVAKRPGAVREGAHGLFSSVPNLDLDKVAEEVASYRGRIWRNVISIRREDADRLGYNTQQPWKQAVQQQLDSIAENFHIPLEHLRWYAGMHDTGHHPHIHLFVFSTDPKEGKLTAAGIRNLKHGFSEIIFADERLHIYEQKDEVKEDLKERASRILSDLENSDQFSPERAKTIYQNLLQLGTSVQSYSGRHFYKYLPQDQKALTDKLLKELTSAPDIQKLYGLYCSLQENLERMYVNEPHSAPINENKEFYVLKNKIVQFAEKLAGTVSGDMGDAATQKQDKSESSIDDNDTPTIKTDDYNFSSLIENTPPEPESPYEQESKFPFPEKLPEEVIFHDSGQTHDIDTILSLKDKATGPEGDKDARYELGKRYLYGDGVDRDCEQARMWFGLAAEQGHYLAEYQLGKMYLYANGIEKDLTKGKEYCLEAYYDIMRELEERTGARLLLGTYYPSECLTVEKHYAYLEYLIGKMEFSGEGVQQDDSQAFTWFQASALHGHVHAEYMVAKMYYEGRGVVQDYSEALQLYEEAARSNDKYACYSAGQMYFRGIGTEQDYQKAASYFARASKENVAYADYILAQIYETGQGVDKDLHVPFILYHKALKEFLEQERRQPDPLTQLRLAEMYLHGQGVETDTAQAADWFQKAVDSGDPQATYELAKLYLSGDGVEKDIEKSQSLYHTALQGFLNSEKENASAGREYRIAGMYENGLGTEKNEQAVIQWYTAAAENGHGHAAYRLGRIYQDGEVTEQDLSAALHWFEKAAELKDKFAYYALGRLYYNGSGVQQDYLQAVEWFQKASDEKIPYAAYILAEMFSAGKGVPDDSQRSTELFHKALDGFMEQEKQKPDPLTQLRIAEMYLHGQGVRTDTAQAVEWFQKAAATGNCQAAFELATLYAEGNGVKADPEKAQRLYRSALTGFVDADQSHPDADVEYRIAHMYEKGMGAEANIMEAFRWYKIAADAGHGFAQYRLARMYQDTQPLEANRYFALALRTFIREDGELPDANREYRIARILSRQGIQSGPNSDIAARWYEASANRGNAQAAYELARILEQDPSKNDLEKVRKYYWLALNGFQKMFAGEESTEREIQLALKIGKIYRDTGNTPDMMSSAFRWFHFAAATGDPFAQFQIGKMLLKGIGCTQDNRQAFAWFLRSAEQGNSHAQYQVGKMYEQGTGIKSNYTTARHYYQEAEANGNEAASARLDYLANREKYEAGAVVSSLLRLIGNNVNGRIEDSTTRRFGMDRKALRQKRRMKGPAQEEDLDEVM